MRFRGIIFDFNGVLFWDADLQVLSWQPVARKLRGYEMSPLELDAQMHGRPNPYVMSYLAGRPIEGQELKDLIQLKEGYYRILCLSNPDKFVLSPGAEPLLDALVAAGIPRTIATSSEITNVRFFIEHLRLARWFDVSQIVYTTVSAQANPLRISTKLPRRIWILRLRIASLWKTPSRGLLLHMPQASGTSSAWRRHPRMHGWPHTRAWRRSSRALMSVLPIHVNDGRLASRKTVTSEPPEAP
jgi:phosphoglycolate phosphatase-like HAD superfamily hydrolase